MKKLDLCILICVIQGLLRNKKHFSGIRPILVASVIGIVITYPDTRSLRGTVPLESARPYGNGTYVMNRQHRDLK